MRRLDATKAKYTAGVRPEPLGNFPKTGDMPELPDNPAGLMELSDAELESVVEAVAKTKTTASFQHWTQSSSRLGSATDHRIRSQ
jgi:hypothetical protein